MKEQTINYLITRKNANEEHSHWLHHFKYSQLGRFSSLKLLTVLKRCLRKSRYLLSVHSNFSLAQFILYVVQDSLGFIFHELDTKKNAFSTELYYPL